MTNGYTHPFIATKKGSSQSAVTKQQDVATHQTNVDRNKVIAFRAELDVFYNETMVKPADKEESVDCYAEILIVHVWNVFDVDS